MDYSRFSLFQLFIIIENLSWEKHRLASLPSWLSQPSLSTLSVTSRRFTIRTSSSGRASTTSSIHQQRRATELESGSKTLSSFRITTNASRRDFRATKLKWTILLISPQKNSEPSISPPSKSNNHPKVTLEIQANVLARHHKANNILKLIGPKKEQ